jgi:hypothetical protein
MAVMLAPMVEPATVPEPPALPVLAFGVAGLALLRRRGRTRRT